MSHDLPVDLFTAAPSDEPDWLAAERVESLAALVSIDDHRPATSERPPQLTLVHNLATLTLPAAFWDATPRLAAIRDAAYSRGRAPTAVLGAVLTRVCAELAAVYVLPQIVGAIGSLNFAAALIGPSGSGKSTADELAGELLRFPAATTAGDPAPQHLPLGSGEGIAEAYMGQRAATADEKDAGLGKGGIVREQARYRNRFVGDEGEAITAQRGRQGSTLMPTLRTVITGGTLGQQNAAADNRRHIPAHFYRAAVLIGFQPETAVHLLADADGGTPQRFAYFAALDHTIPDIDDRPEWPGELLVDMPTAAWTEQLPQARHRRLIPVTDVARREVQAEDHARNTGTSDSDPLDSHRNLVRLKVAALLHVLNHGRPEVSEQSWHLAGMLLHHSRAVLNHIAAHQVAAAAELAAARNRAAADQKVSEEDAVTRRAFEGALRAAARAVSRHQHGSSDHAGKGCPLRCLHQAPSGQHRKLVTMEDVVAEAVARGHLVDAAGRFHVGERPL